MGTTSEGEVGHLLDRWKQGDRDDGGWYRTLRGPMRRAAWRGIQRMTGRRPPDEDVDEVLHDAFLEFLDRDPSEITSPIGLAKSIAYRRGQDRGRRLNRSREFPDSESIEAESDQRQGRVIPVMQDPLPGPEDALLEAERADEQERLLKLTLECLDGLPPGQAEVVRATILRQKNMSDWAHEKGKSYTAADEQRKRALQALQRCVEARMGEEGGDHVV
jgi:DNA-directed RNA polymerase specialized sigma24 family protein